MKNPLNDIDAQDVGDVLKKIEHSFGIEFTDSELTDLPTFGTLCDLVTDKIACEQTDASIFPEAYNRIRTIIADFTPYKKEQIIFSDQLASLIIKENRKKVVKRLENELDVKLDLLKSPVGYQLLFILLFVLSWFLFALHALMAIIGVTFSVAALNLSGRWGNSFKVNTVGELVEKVTRENYLQVQTQPKHFNKAEVDKFVIDLFINELSLEKSEINSETKLR